MDNLILQLKQNNHLLNIIRCNPGISKNALTEIFDVSLPTMANTIESCRKSGILFTDPSIHINADYAHMIGLSIGSAQTKLCIINMNFEMITSDIFKQIVKKLNIFKVASSYMQEKKIPLENFICFETPDNLFDLQSQLDLCMNDIINIIEHQNEFKLNIISVGLTFTGTVDNFSKKIIKSHNLDFISDKPLSNIVFPNRIDYFESKSINIYVDNNSNSATVAEKYNLYNVASSNYKFRNKQNIMAIYLGAGIGTGLIFHNKLYRGASNAIGELGHIQVPPYYEKNNSPSTNEICCSCGNDNCLDFRIRNDVFNMTKADFSKMSSKDIATYFTVHSEKLDVMAYYIGYITNLVINILNLDIIVFTGKFKLIMDQLWLPLYKYINSNKLSYISNDCVLAVSPLGVAAPAIGVAISSYFDKINEDIEW